MDIDRDSLIERSGIVWRLVVAFGLCAVATLWVVPKMLEGSSDGSWLDYLVGVVGGIGAIVIGSIIKPMWFIARKPTARRFVEAAAVVVAAQVAMSLWFDEMSTTFQLVLLGAAVGVFSSLFVATYLVTDQARRNESEEPRV